MTRYLPLATVVILVGAVAIVQGFWTERWGKFDTEDISHRVHCLKEVPMEFGRWKGEDTPLDQRQLKIAKVSGVIQRVYRNLDTGDSISIYLATGKARAISVHTPDKCYQALGFRLAEDQVSVPVKYKVGDKPRSAECYRGHFRKDTTDGNLHLTIFWTWNATGKWEAPALPKVAFAKYPALYKMYAIRQTRPGETLEKDPTVTFLEEFLPVLDEVLTPSSTSAPSVAVGPSSVKAT